METCRAVDGLCPHPVPGYGRNCYCELHQLRYNPPLEEPIDTHKLLLWVDEALDLLRNAKSAAGIAESPRSTGDDTGRRL